MTVARRRATRGYLKFLGVLFLICGGLVSVGYIPTSRAGGEGALVAMLAAAALVLAGSAAGGLAVAAGASGAVAPGPGLTLAAMAVRLGLVVGGASLLTFSRLVEPRAFLIWVAISYLVLLPADVRYALRAPAEIDTQT